jgi:hypothetical protein
MLPRDGGVYDQDESDVKRLLGIYALIDDYREMEMKKAAEDTSGNRQR